VGRQADPSAPLLDERSANEDRVDDAVQELVKVARLYYEDELSQQEIAVQLEKSRPTISRMLKAARAQGIVSIDIRAPSNRSRALELALQERFELDDARVVLMPRGEQDSTDRLARAAANYLQLVLRDGLTIGVSNGRTLATTARYLRPERTLELSVVQIIGSLGNDNPRIDGYDIVRSLAEAYGSDYRYLHVPLLVESKEVRETLLRDRNVSQTLRMGSDADVAIVGLGSLNDLDRSPVFDGFLTPEDIALIREAEAVGHCCGEFYMLDGRPAATDVNDRTIAIGLDALRSIPTVIAVAGGATKASSIIGALRGRFINTLITDDRAALRLIEMDDD
jgi:DNA-binding transcriptional regulator LsrR (DeoR family)